MLIFTPHLCGPREALEVLEGTLAYVDVIQVRPKDPDLATAAPSAARETFDWTLRVLDLLRAHPDVDIPVVVNDRVDVAKALWTRGCAGVHVGQDDSPVEIARRLLGPLPILGVSTHDMTQVAEACEAPVDYLGFGPIHATATKGYVRGLGSDAYWVARSSCERPVFAIGGIARENIGELEHHGRAAVGSAVLSADDPERAARELRKLLTGE